MNRQAQEKAAMDLLAKLWATDRARYREAIRWLEARAKKSPPTVGGAS